MLDDRDAITKAVEHALKNYQLRNMVYDEHPDAPYRLVDLLTPTGEKNIASGAEELARLADFISNTLASLQQEPSPAPVAVGDDDGSLRWAALRLAQEAEIDGLSDRAGWDCWVALVKSRSALQPSPAREEAAERERDGLLRVVTDNHDANCRAEAAEARAEAAEAERDDLRAAIFGPHRYDPTLKNRAFVEMAQATEAGRVGAVSRATAAETDAAAARKRVRELEAENIEREAELIYLRMYGKDGAVWHANHSKDVWREKARAALGRQE